MLARGLVVGSLVLVAGCDQVFGFGDFPSVDEVTKHHGRVFNDPDGDVDNDGVPNASDLCPLDDNSQIGAGVDTDGDGVGDLCDPAPKVPGDCVALFDDFAFDQPLSSHWKSQGAPVHVDPLDGLFIDVADETVVYLDEPLDITTVISGGYIHQGGTGSRAIQLFTDIAFAPQVNGVACGPHGPAGATSIAVVDVADGIDTVVVEQAIPGGIPLAAGTDIDFAWGGRTTASCRAVLNTTTASQGGEVARDPSSLGGVFGLRVVNAGFIVGVVVGYGHHCQ
jgi:hypothetical protein